MNVLRVLRFWLRAVPPLMLLVFPVLCLSDWIWPDEEASEALRGAGYTYRLRIGTGEHHEEGIRSVSRTYIAGTGLRRLPELVTVLRFPQSLIVASDGSGGLGLPLGMNLLFLYLTWRWWILPLRRDGREGLRRAAG